jgi:transposase-like protein
MHTSVARHGKPLGGCRVHGHRVKVFSWDRRWIMGRRTLSREYRLEAVRLVRDRGASVGESALDIGVHENVLRKGSRIGRRIPGGRSQARAR